MYGYTREDAHLDEIDLRCEESYKKGRADAIDEALQSIHNTYALDLHCMADYCERDSKGYDCEDCLYKSIKQNLEQLKENTNE